MICSSSKPPFIIYFQGNVLNSKKSKKKSQVVNLHLNKNPKFSQKVSGHSPPTSQDQRMGRWSLPWPELRIVRQLHGSTDRAAGSVLHGEAASRKRWGNEFWTRKRWYILLYIYIYNMWMYIYIYTCIYIYICVICECIYIYVYKLWCHTQ